MSGAPIALLGIGALVAGCAPTGPIAVYEGAPRDRSKIAVIHRSGAGAGLTVFRIDDHDTRGFEWHVEPGPHRICVELKQYGEALNVEYKVWAYCPIDFEAEAGGTYRIISQNGQRRAAGDTEVSLGVLLVDAKQAIVGAPVGCDDRRPRFAAP
jgi:hypothetical protein